LGGIIAELSTIKNPKIQSLRLAILVFKSKIIKRTSKKIP
jgi:hypothetical protein